MLDDVLDLDLSDLDGLEDALSRAQIEADRDDCASSLVTFIQAAWHLLEPAAPYLHNWHIDAMCDHLEAISDGVEVDGSVYNRLLVNVPPGAMKSLLTSVFWPAWEWGPRGDAHLRYICASHSQDLAVRDSLKMRRLVTSEWYQARWPHIVLTADQNSKLKFENTSSGFRQAIAAGSITGVRAHRVIIDDPHSVMSAESEAERKTAVQWMREAVPLRLDDPIESAIVVIMQRLHEDDVSGALLEAGLGYDHLMLPMRYDPLRAAPTRIGFVDPREEPGELLFPDRFPLDVVDRDERALGPYATAGQFQQEPMPRGGGVVKREWWQLWDRPAYPPMTHIVASLDTAYTTKAENDFSALTVWGVYSADPVAREMKLPDGTVTRAYSEHGSRIMLMDAWAERLELHDLVQKAVRTCKKFKVDTLLIENKASGYSVAQELRRLFAWEDWAVRLVDPKGQDKLARLYSVQHLFSESMVFAPDRAWADQVITQTAVFPRGKHDDLVDTVSQALRHVREIGVLERNEERMAEMAEAIQYNSGVFTPLYPS